MIATGKTKPAAVTSGTPADGGLAVLSGQENITTFTQKVKSFVCDPQRDPLVLELAQRAELAQAAGDRLAYLAARRAMLLRQAALIAEMRQ